MEVLIAVAVVAVLIVFVMMTRTSYATGDVELIRTLYRQSARYAVASIQDDAEVIQMLHANYAMGYLLALKDVASTEDFKRATGEDLISFERKIAQIQDAATTRIIKDRPDLRPLDDPTLMRAIYFS
jgi:putative exporter of polyketide antibiotics